MDVETPGDGVGEDTTEGSRGHSSSPGGEESDGPYHTHSGRQESDGVIAISVMARQERETRKAREAES